jgi:hypothetical protein
MHPRCHPERVLLNPTPYVVILRAHAGRLLRYRHLGARRIYSRMPRENPGFGADAGHRSFGSRPDFRAVAGFRAAAPFYEPRCQALPGGRTIPPRGRICENPPLSCNPAPPSRAASTWSGHSRCPCTTFYPCRHEADHPIPYSPAGESWKRGRGAPSQDRSALADPGAKRVLAPALRGVLSLASLLPPPPHPAQLAFSSAPAGGVPVLRYLQSSISSLRASATIPIRRIRELPCPYFRWYHWLSSLCGW